MPVVDHDSDIGCDPMILGLGYHWQDTISVIEYPISGPNRDQYQGQYRVSRYPSGFLLTYDVVGQTYYIVK